MVRKIKMKEKLNKIAEQYKKEYNLDTTIDIVLSGENCYFRKETNYIFFAISYIKKIYKEPCYVKRVRYKALKSHLIFALLHEIYHAIDYKNNSKQYMTESAEMNWGLYREDYEYHISRPFEERADEFARKELVKWI